MTLHWWMHWFWVTAQIVVSLTSPTSERTTGSSAVIPDSSSSIPPLPPIVTSPSSGPSPDITRMQQQQQQQQQHQSSTTELPLDKPQQSYRVAKAIGIQPQSMVTTTTGSAAESHMRLAEAGVTSEPARNLQFAAHFAGSTVSTYSDAASGSGLERIRSTPRPTDNHTSSWYDNSDNKTTQPGRIPGKKESKITWIHAFSKPPRPKYEEKTSSPSPSTIDPDELTVMPLQEELEESRPKGLTDPNSIRRDQLLVPPPPPPELPEPAAPLQPSVNRSGEQQLLLGEATVEPHAVATAASVIDAGLGDSTRLGRARGTFTSEFQRDQLSREEQRTESKEKTIKEAAEGGANVTEIATITGSCLAIIILLSTVGSLGFIMYRRRYLNPPQTLNSDKCSNPDSSGYIDDSTIRDNSEEMYSLDNDSFLNSLEAMTIQNYWTDSVKHTKL